MFGTFRSKRDRAAAAVAAFLREKLESSFSLPVGALSDPYCLGFLQMVGVHVASHSLPQGSCMTEAKAVFEQVLMRRSPEAAEVLFYLEKDEAFRRGKTDGDLYTGWTLLHIAPERDGRAALERFFDRVREVTSPRKAQSATDRPSPSTAGGERGGARGSVRWTDWQAEDKSEGFDGPTKQDIRRTYTFSDLNAPESAATLTIVCALEATVMPDTESVSLDRKLRFYLRPFRLPHEAEFVMRLAMRDEAEGGEFDVAATPAEAGGDTAIIAKYGGRNDVATCIATLRSGRDMVFMLRDQRESLVNFLLPNDGSFQRLYDETVERLQQRAVVNQMLSYNAELQRGQKTHTEPHTVAKTSAASNQNTVLTQLPEVEAALGRCVVDFQDRTKLHYVLIFPIMHKMAVKLFVEDFGIETALQHYQRLVASLTSEGTIREDQFKSFGWPEVSPQEAPRVQELDALLWKLARDLIGRGILKETIASALLNVTLRAASKMDPLLSAGFLVTALKELRAGLHTPHPEVRLEAAEGSDELTTLIFNQLRDLAYTFKEHSGLEWQHLLPGMQRVCVIYCIKYQGRDGAIALFRQQVRRLAPVLDQCQENPPQQLPVTPVQIKNTSMFNEAFQKLADTYIDEIPDIHPVRIAHALSMLISKLASTHYDVIYFSGILSSSCADIEQGKYDFVRKTH